VKVFVRSGENSFSITEISIGKDPAKNEGKFHGFGLGCNVSPQVQSPASWIKVEMRFAAYFIMRIAGS
jgi:hypothetical protein